ncbi:MAG TPA: hypothetical protein VMV73_03230, partial [Candidatus Dormibacteraeota bacterium]|nr:hypothetical protein [Candidatus Dormibacteraeota bacterium]
AIVAYLSSLDGGAGGTLPTMSWSPIGSSDAVEVSVRFPGTAPAHPTIETLMSMGGGDMHSASYSLVETSDPHLWKTRVDFSMAGPWTLRLLYGDKHLDRAIEVGGSP